MATLITEEIKVTVSRLVKQGEKSAPLVNAELAASVEAIVQELLGDANAVVEVTPDV